MLINPRKAERHPWELFFVGLFYASIAVILVNWIFSKDFVLSKFSGILIITFTVMASMPFIYYTIKLEENRVKKNIRAFPLLEKHRHAIYSFLWLFIGFVVAFSFWYMVLPSLNFAPQIGTYCSINQPSQFSACMTHYGIKGDVTGTGYSTGPQRVFMIFTNNLYVLLFTLLFSLVFGAGAIFILAWNASVIAAAVGIFTQKSLVELPIGFLRFMIHGIPEIAAYFIVALAGGMISVAVIKHEAGTDKFWHVLQDSMNLVIAAIVILFIAALIETFVTPLLF